jgi:hypothetical protein
MTPAQQRLLKELIAADRLYHSKKAAKILTCNDERGVEINHINGIEMNTARALVERGLAEMVDIGKRHPYAFLGKYLPYDPVE